MMPFTWTHGQMTKLRTIQKSHFNGLSPARQVNAIAKWIEANNTGGIKTFPITRDVDIATYVEEIGKFMGTYTDHPVFQAGLKPLAGNGSLYKEVNGTYGKVPAGVVYQVCTKYKIQRNVIDQACRKYAKAQGDNGIKVLEGHKSYEAELKLMAMGGERVYAKTKVGGKYVFDNIAKHT